MTTIDAQEVEKFSKIAEEWWDENGKFKPLHKFNPIRLKFIRTEICDFFSRDKNLLTPLKGLKILDIGCGGGLVSEPISRMGADLTAIDASQKNINIAKIHAQKSALNIDYQVSSAEELAQSSQKFDVVLALEIIEHVADVEKFIESCQKLLKPNGLLFIATLNRTAKSLLMAKIGVEYVLRWLPVGTHDWRKFLKPSEIFNHIQNITHIQNNPKKISNEPTQDSPLNHEPNSINLNLKKIQGFSYNIFKDEWSLSDDLSVNYCMVLSTDR